MKFARQTAYKLWISDLLNAEYNKGAGEFDPGFLTVRNLEVSRVNLVGVVVDKSNLDNYMIVTLDDGSGGITLRLWGEDINLFSTAEVGKFLFVIGRVKMFNNAKYILPEIIKVVNPSWIKLRRLELNRTYGEPIKIEKFNVEELGPPSDIVYEEVVGDVNEERGKILTILESQDKGDGVEIEKVIRESKVSNAEAIIQELLKDGEIFEVKMGKLRILP